MNSMENLDENMGMISSNMNGGSLASCPGGEVPRFSIEISSFFFRDFLSFSICA